MNNQYYETKFLNEVVILRLLKIDYTYSLKVGNTVYFVYEGEQVEKKVMVYQIGSIYFVPQATVNTQNLLDAGIVTCLLTIGELSTLIGRRLLYVEPIWLCESLKRIRSMVHKLVLESCEGERVYREV